MFRSRAPTFLLVLVTGFFLLRESRHRPVSAMEDGFATWLSLNGVPRESRAKASVTLVNLDAEGGGSAGVTPLDISIALNSALAFHPAVEAVEVPLDWTGEKLSEKDREELPQTRKILENVLLRTPKLVLSGTLGREAAVGGASADFSPVPLQHVTGDVSQVPEWNSIGRMPEDAFRSAGELGFINLPAVDGVRRAVPLVLRFQGELVPSFVLETVRLWARKTSDEVQVRLGSEILLGSDLRIPIDTCGQMRVNFRPEWSSISAADLVLAAREQELGRKPILPTAGLEGGVLLFGQNAPAQHQLRMPTLLPGSELELFAAAIATIQSRNFLRSVPEWVEWLIILAAAIGALWLPRFSRGAVVMSVFIGWVSYGLLSMAIATYVYYCLPFVLPVGMGAALCLLRLALPKYRKMAEVQGALLSLESEG